MHAAYYMLFCLALFLLQTFQLAETAPPAVGEPAGRIFGLTVVEWGVLLGAVGTFIEALRQRSGRAIESKKLAVAREVIAESAVDPEARKSARAKVEAKGTRMGVSLHVLKSLLESRDEEFEPSPDPDDETKTDFKAGPSE